MLSQSHEFLTLCVILLILVLACIGGGVYCCHRAAENFVAAAGPGNADYGIELINGFVLSRSSSRDRAVVGPLHNQGANPAVQTNFWVPSDVTQIGWDDRYILCWSSGGWWLVDTTKPQRYGPMNEQALKQLRDELGVSPELRLCPTPEGQGDVVRPDWQQCSSGCGKPPSSGRTTTQPG